MQNASAILDLGMVLLAAGAFGAAARRLGLPAVVGYLALGLVVSPFTPGYVADRRQIELLADVGVVLLLFEVGIELDLGRLRREYAGLLWAAPLQVVLTTLAAGGVIWTVGIAPLPAAILGLCVALSSSVVIVNITRSRRRTTDPPTEAALLGWGVLQDLVGVGAAAVLLAGLGAGERPLLLALAGLLAYAALALGTAWLLPRALHPLREQHDLFLVLSVGSGLALAGAGAVVFGVPLALAAFVAGLVIAEDPTTAEVRRRLLPFRDVFAVLFFVAIGMLLDPAELAAGLPWMALFLSLIVIAKVALSYGLVRLAHLPGRPLQIAIGLGQVGEFSFVLGSALLADQAIEASVYVALVAAASLSIGVSAVAARAVGRPAAAAGSGLQATSG
jgi:CPA2 family monovalent cation:H+ antiporter-2